MIEVMHRNLQAAHCEAGARELLADAGYYSEANRCEQAGSAGPELLLNDPQRSATGASARLPPRGRIPAGLSTSVNGLDRKLATQRGRVSTSSGAG